MADETARERSRRGARIYTSGNAGAIVPAESPSARGMGESAGALGTAGERDEQRSVGATRDPQNDLIVAFPGITGPGAEPNVDPSWETQGPLEGASHGTIADFDDLRQQLRERMIGLDEDEQRRADAGAERAANVLGMQGSAAAGTGDQATMGGAGMGQGTSGSGALAGQAGTAAAGGTSSMSGSGTSGARGVQGGGEGTGNRGGGTGNMGGGTGSDIGTAGARGGMGGTGSDVANAATSGGQRGASGMDIHDRGLAAGTGGGVAANQGRGGDVGGGAVSGYADEDAVRGGMSGGTTGGIRESEASGMSGGMRSAMGTDARGGMGTEAADTADASHEDQPQAAAEQRIPGGEQAHIQPDDATAEDSPADKSVRQRRSSVGGDVSRRDSNIKTD